MLISYFHSVPYLMYINHLNLMLPKNVIYKLPLFLLMNSINALNLHQKLIQMNCSIVMYVEKTLIFVCRQHGLSVQIVSNLFIVPDVMSRLMVKFTIFCIIVIDRGALILFDRRARVSDESSSDDENDT